MLTPQQIQEISFEKALFGGYDMDSVDEVLEPLTEDYVTLYKENSVLKSKMRILVEKLEEYRNREASMQSAILAAQKTCEQMTADAERRCAKMLREAEETAKEKTANISAMVGGEQERLKMAQEVCGRFIDDMEHRLNRQLELLEELRKQEQLPAAKAQSTEEKQAFDFDKNPPAPTTEEKADALIEEIGLRIEESLKRSQEPPLVTKVDAAPESTKPTQPDSMSNTLHGNLSPAKQKLFDDLQFGHEKK